MNLEPIKVKLRPIFYPIFDFFLDISVNISERIFDKQGLSRVLLNIWNVVLYPFGFRVYKVYSHEKYTKQIQGEVNTIVANRKGKAIGLVYNIGDAPEVMDVDLPDLFVVTYSHIDICGNSDCIIDSDNSIVVNDFAATMDTDRFSNPYGVIRIQKNRCALVMRRQMMKSINRGLSICTPGAGNLYHCLYDCMTKLYAINKYNILPDYPLIADDSIAKIPQLMELFELINKSKRDVIWVKDRAAYHVVDFAIISSVNEIPVQLKCTDNIKTGDFKYDISFLKDFVDNLLQFKSKDTFPSKILLSRKKFSRRSFNETDIIEVAKRHGIEIVHPESLSFRQQMALFNGAELIVGATGAAFTNLLFCGVGSTSVCLIGVDVNLPIFTGGAYTSSSKLIYQIGYTTGKALRYKIQSAFYMDPLKFDMFLNSIDKAHGNKE